MSGQGSAGVVIKEYDLADMVPSFTGVSGAIVLDAGRGQVNQEILVTNEKQFMETFVAPFGKPEPKKFGLGIYSALNFLKSSGQLYVARVDKGQLFATALVRAKINPYTEVDENGFIIEAPVVDPIVKPLGAMSQHDLDGYGFVQYPRDRVVAQFLPEIHLADRPYDGDTKLVLDNIAPIEVGQKITLKDTTGLPQDVTLGYPTYTVVEKQRELLRSEYLVLDDDVQPFAFDSGVRAVNTSYVPYTPAAHTVVPAVFGTANIVAPRSSGIVGGDTLKVTGHDTLFKVQSVVNKLGFYGFAASLTVSMAANSAVAVVTGDISQVAVGDVVGDSSNSFTVQAISGQTLIATLPNVAGFAAGTELLKQYDVTEILLTGNLDITLPAGTSLTKEVKSVVQYSPLVYAKEVVAGFPNKIRVSNHDPVAEGDTIVINGTQYKVLAKETLENYANTVTLDKAYRSTTLDVPGVSVFDVVHDDFEHRDAFLVYEESPGSWGNRTAIAIRDSKNYQNAFNLDVYYDGVLVETWEVTRDMELDGFGQQLFMETKINTSSKYIRVKNNPFMVGDDGSTLVEPLKTLYYIRQPVAQPLYTKVADVLETIWDGDNLIRVAPETIYDLNVSRPVHIGGKSYDISRLQSSVVGGVLDTIVLQQAVSLGLDALPANERYLPIGSDVGQQLNRNQKDGISIPNITPQTLYSVVVNGVTYTQNSTNLTAEETLRALGARIEAGVNVKVSALVSVSIGVPTLVLRALTAGVPYTVSVSSGMVLTSLATNAREWQSFPTQRINGAIMPANTIGSVVTLPGGSYTILDAGANRMTGGWDGEYPTVGQYLTCLDTCFQDPERVDYLVLLDGGTTHKAYQQRMVEIAQTRMFCVALLSVSYQAQANPNLLAGPVAFRQDLMLDSSYGALYTPWLKVFDKFNNQEIWISPESFAARALSYVAAKREIWYAPAGWNNAKIIALDVGQKYTKPERDVLYDNQINPIRFDPEKGLAIWGQKTLQVRPSDTSYLGSRILLIVIEKGISGYLEFKNFEMNTESTRKLARINMEEFLQGIKVREGLEAYKVVCDESNNPPEVRRRREMYLDTYVQLTPDAEFITGRVVITPQGMSFALVQL